MHPIDTKRLRGRTSIWTTTARSIWRVVGVYAVVSALWILGSDGLLAFLVKDPEVMTGISIIKGWLFVAMTSALLYWLTHQLKAALLTEQTERVETLARLGRETVERLRAEEKLAKDGVFLQTLVQAVPDMIWLKSTDGTFLACNTAFETFFGLTPGQIIGKTDEAAVDPEVARVCHQADLTVISTKNPHIAEEWMAPLIGGRRGLFETIKTPMLDDMGRLIGVLGIAREITETRKAKDALRESEALLRQSQHVAMLGYGVFDVRSQHWTSSEALDAILGIDASFEHDLESWLSLLHPQERDEVTAMITELSLGRKRSFEKEFRIIRRSDGSERWLSGVGQLETDKDNSAVQLFGTFQDITERKRAERRIEFLAQHDWLTELPNRVLLQQRLEQAISQAKRTGHKIAILFLDLDNFKSVNDSLGHAAGDEFLKGLARRLESGVRATDTVSRQGGDEFLIILGDLPDTASVLTILTKLMRTVQLPLYLGGHEVSSSASVGVVFYPDDGLDYATLLQKADMAMYRAKEGGRNTYRFFDEQANAENVGKLQLRNDLRRALERQEFILHYQPQFDLNDGRLIGAEALIRWQSPERGLVAPGEFIPIAEASGLMTPIGDWVLREACREAAGWPDGENGPLTIAVNLSATQFLDGGLQAQVIDALEDSGLDPTRLELELTESLLIRDPDTVLALLHALKRQGIQFSIDDFGTGYSSLAYLKRFAVDRLKIDRSFVRDLADNGEDAAIVTAIIQMARSLGLKTVAEGIETDTVKTRLEALGCEHGQGYLLGRPMSSEAFRALLSASMAESSRV